MSSRIAALRPLLIASSLVFASSHTARGGVIVQYGDYLSPTAALVHMPFETSYNFPIHVDTEFFSFSASPFQAAVNGQAIEITTFGFFDNLIGSGNVSIDALHRELTSNVYDVYMTAGGGHRSFFGQFRGGNPFCAFTACVLDPSSGCLAVSPTCMPEGAGAVGHYLYDPSLGDLGIEMVEAVDIASNISNYPNFFFDQYTPGGPTGIVTRFAGAVVATPEPSSLSLVVLGVLPIAGVFVRRRLMRK